MIIQQNNHLKNILDVNKFKISDQDFLESVVGDLRSQDVLGIFMEEHD